MAEAEPARDVGGADEIATLEIVERVDRARLFQAGGGSRELGLERVARDRRALERLAGVAREQRELGGQRGRDRARHLYAAERDRGAGAFLARRARELLQVERVAAAVGVQRVGGVADQFARLGLAQVAELDPGQVGGALQRPREPLRHLARADGDREQHARGGRPSQQRAEQFDRAGIGPVQVVQDQHQRLRRRQRLQQLPHGSVEAIALVLLVAAWQRREYLAELRREPAKRSPRTRRAHPRTPRTADPTRAPTRCPPAPETPGGRLAPPARPASVSCRARARRPARPRRTCASRRSPGTRRGRRAQRRAPPEARMRRP